MQEPKFLPQIMPDLSEGFVDGLTKAADSFQKYNFKDFPWLKVKSSPTAEEKTELLASAKLSGFLVPAYMNNIDFPDWWLENRDGSKTWLPEPDTAVYPTITKDKIIVGIIDVGIAFGHRRFRLQDGETRILGAWQQGAPFRGTEHLPFGDALFQDDIKDLLMEFSQGKDLKKPLDQDGFNRAADLVNYEIPEAGRHLAHRAAHGTHVMGLAGGAEPGSDFAKRIRFLVVNLPPPVAYAEGGAFLDAYLTYAIRWIYEVKKRIEQTSELANSVPMILNVSFGKQAGGKDASQLFVKTLQSVAGRSRKSPAHIVIPAGNDNLNRIHARKRIVRNAALSIPFRIKPDDVTSNFIEVWMDPEWRSGARRAPLQISVVPPGQEPDTVTAGIDGQIKELKDGFGRIYCERVTGGNGYRPRFRYLICLTPDRYGGEVNKTGAPAGLWTLILRNPNVSMVRAMIQVQTDQATLPGLSGARRPYLDHPEYQRFEDLTRIRDTYEYTPGEDDPASLDWPGPVRRHGTLNGYSQNSFVTCIAGYRWTDGRPAPYSSSGAQYKRNANDRGAPTVAFITDEGAAHFGVLSDGASDGSTVALRGTSFASAAATRFVVERWLAGKLDPEIKLSDFFKGLFKAKEEASKPRDEWLGAGVDIEKCGRGRVDWRPDGRVDRFG